MAGLQVRSVFYWVLVDIGNCHMFWLEIGNLHWNPETEMDTHQAEKEQEQGQYKDPNSYN